MTWQTTLAREKELRRIAEIAFESRTSSKQATRDLMMGLAIGAACLCALLAWW